ncbi:50S ribosomal protein L24P [Halogeometricum borinquense DSM 11551]|uniref:Large ribosomal subunit protein uL24 n=2 Tax=Halogeometricum borinquense TaxID=60847 RepID=E4NQ64_HALBP|nr:50S ribosomal protein L24 [Halogeometricum borinquense]ADQ66626.1 LSU ribosomal protein L24P [Halogeometricum borinquense DSM 11551]ELY30733.1 50S ribosomal protein L24P [Halogeometricum borinquense DSM 11551]RYJ14473.1 50S ribosomal protein L24 [Halogeometricum borinquense]
MTKQPRKQRNETQNAPLHERQKQVRATLTDDLREEYGQRNVRVNAGDTVEVLRGDAAGTEAEVTDIDLKDAVVYVEDVTVAKADGEEVPRPLDASNIRVTELDLEDERRESRLKAEDNE